MYCGGNYCSKCAGIMWLILGVLILINQFWLGWQWWTFVGAVFVLKGIIQTAKPSCPCHDKEKKK